MTWELVLAFWPFLAAIASIVSPIACAAFLLWLKSQFATRAALDAEVNRIDAAQKVADARIDLMKEAELMLKGRVEKLEDHCSAPPSRTELSKEIGGLAARMASVEKGVSSLERIGGTTNNYLQTLIEQGLRK